MNSRVVMPSVYFEEAHRQGKNMKKYSIYLILSEIFVCLMTACNDEDDLIYVNNESCDNACNLGEWSCLSDGYKICIKDESGCPSWSTLKSCPANTLCNPQKRECINDNSGSDECNSECIEDETICSEDKSQILICKHIDSLNCNALIESERCEDNKKCESDGINTICTKESVCTQGEMQCSAAGNALMTCVTNDDGEEDWNIENCPDGQVCSDGQCRVNCANTCSEGVRQCSANGIPQVCKTQENGCLEWGNETACPEAYHCIEGTCQPNCTKDCDPWSIVILPDTQSYLRDKPEDDTSNTYYQQTKWIKEHKDTELIPNLKMVVHMGDVTESNKAVEWKNAVKAHKVLQDAGIPFTVITGNHDYCGSTSSKNSGERWLTKLPTYFPESCSSAQNCISLKDLPGFGGVFNGVNSYFNFTAAGQDYLVVNLEYGPRQETMCWANKLLQKPDNLNKKVIFTTHAYLTHNAEFDENLDNVLDYGAGGREIWNGLVSRHSNVIMILNGHVGDSERKESKGNNQNTVVQILTDYQFEVPCHSDVQSLADCKSNCAWVGDAGNGWLRIMTFDPKTNNVKVKTLSIHDGDKEHFSNEGKAQFFCSEITGNNSYPADPNDKDHNYEFTFDFTTPMHNVYDDGGYYGFVNRTINYHGDGDQIHPSVAAAPDGHFVVVWEDNSKSDDGNQYQSDTPAYDIYGRIMTPGGCELDNNPEILISTNTNGHQSEPDVAMDKDGNFVVVWTDDCDGNGSTQVLMRGFNADGTERFATQNVNQVDTGDQYQPHIAMASDGQFAVSWTDTRLGAQKPQIWVRGYKADGSQNFAERKLIESTTGTQVHSDIFMDDAHNFVVAWEDDSDGNTLTESMMILFNPDGTPKTGLTKINSNPDGNQNAPSISGKSDGSSFFVTWTDIKASDVHKIMIAKFDGNGKKLLTDSEVSQASVQNDDSHVCMTSSGDAMITWYNPSTRNIIYRKYVEGKFSGESIANMPDNPKYADGISHHPTLACIPGTNFAIVTYSDDADNNTYHEIFGVGLKIK